MRRALAERPFLLASAIFIVGFALRAALWFRNPANLVTERVEIVQTALCFARHGFLGNPFWLRTGPTAHVTPVFPFLLGLLYRWAPTMHTAEIWKSLLTITIASLQFALLPLLAGVSKLGVKVGALAGFIGAVMPNLYLDCAGTYEAPLVGLTTVLVLICTFVLQRKPRRSARRALLTGFVWGCTAVVSAQLLMCGILYECLTRIVQKARLRQWLLLFSGLLLAVLPWTIRNWVELGSPVVSRDNTGLELYVSNNDDAGITTDQNVRSMLLHHPHDNADEAALVRHLGEVQYNNVKMAAAVAWIEAHPKRFAVLTARRFGYFWFLPNGAGAMLGIYWVTLAVFGLAGAYLYWRRGAGILHPFLLLLLIYPLPHYVVQSISRYRYPLNPLLLLFTAYSLLWVARQGRLRSPREEPTAIAA